MFESQSVKRNIENGNYKCTGYDCEDIFSLKSEGLCFVDIFMKVRDIPKSIDKFKFIVSETQFGLLWEMLLSQYESYEKHAKGLIEKQLEEANEEQKILLIKEIRDKWEISSYNICIFVDNVFFIFPCVFQSIPKCVYVYGTKFRRFISRFTNSSDDYVPGCFFNGGTIL